jgi:hypothetical protein
MTQLATRATHATHDWELRQLTEASEEPISATELRALTHVRALTDLFGRRPDLAGVYSPADLTSEALLWSA